LGCILYELCVGKKAFRDDFDTFQFAAKETEFVTDFPTWFDGQAMESYNNLIQSMLHPDYSKRASIESLSKKCCKCISLVSYRNIDELELELNDDDCSLLLSKHLLGTDVTSEESEQNVRWKNIILGEF
jgi:serine/threonine protein kinase